MTKTKTRVCVCVCVCVCACACACVCVRARMPLQYDVFHILSHAEFEGRKGKTGKSLAAKSIFLLTEHNLDGIMITTLTFI